MASTTGPGEQKGSRLATLFSELYKYCQASDYERAVKNCNRILHDFPEDKCAFETKIICCVHLSRFADALEFMAKNPKLSTNLNFEKAYCHYRLHQIPEAKEALLKEKDSFRKSELMAQIQYRLECFEESFEGYREIIKIANDDFEQERQTNLTAIIACLRQQGIKNEITATQVDADNYESHFNKACCLVADGKYKDAKAKFKEIEDMATEYLREDGVADEEIEDELAAIRVQHGLCAHLSGKVKEAMGTYSRVLKGKPSDTGVAAVASNNVLCLNRDQNIFDSKKRVKAMKLDGLDTKLTHYQKKSMLLNQALFGLNTNQPDLCKEACDLLAEQYPDNTLKAVLVKTALICRTSGIKSAKEYADSFISKNPESACIVKLGLVQEMLRRKNVAEAVGLLNELETTDRYRPGVVSALVTLHHTNEATPEAARVLKEAVDYYMKKGSDKDNMNLLWRQAASLMIEQGDHSEAVKSLEELRKSCPDDVVTLAQLIVAYAQYNIDKAKTLSDLLPPINIPEEIDVNFLESSNWLSSVKLLKKTKDSTPPTPISGRSEKSEPEQIVRVRSKSRKKKRRPAPFNPNKEMDPERWLPRYERTGYKPKKSRKGRGEVGKGTQGADSVSAAMYDMSAKVATKTSSDENVNPAWKKEGQKKKKKKR